MLLSEVIHKRLLSGNQASIQIVGVGGGGKTTSFYDTIKCFMEKPALCNGKMVVPIYIPLNKASQECTEMDGCIKLYIWRNCYGNRITMNKTDDILTNLNQLFNEKDGKYHYLLLCDGINETADSGKLVTEILSLASCFNITVCLSCRVLQSDLSNFEIFHLQGIKDDKLNTIFEKNGIGLEISKMDKGSKDILKTPFYLTKWLKMAKSNDMPLTFNQGNLHMSYYNWIIKKTKYSNSAKSILMNNGEKLSFEEALQEALLLLGAISLEMFTANRYIFDETWIDTRLNRYNDGFIQRISRTYKGIGWQRLFDNFYLPLGFFMETDDHAYAYTHQNERDFLCALDICQVINDSHRMIPYNYVCGKDIVRLVSNLLYDSEDITEVKMNDFFKKLHLPSSSDMAGAYTISNLSVYEYVTEGKLESLENFSDEKRAFCEQFYDYSKIIMSYLWNLIYGDNKEIDNTDIQVVRLHCELARRCGKWDEALLQSKKMERLCLDRGKDASSLAHQRAKTELLSAHEEAAYVRVKNTECPESAPDKTKIVQDFSSAINDLALLSKATWLMESYAEDPQNKVYIPSSNLLSLLLAFPDPISKPYLEAVWKEKSMLQRKVDACKLLWNAACETINDDRNTIDLRRYGLRQLVLLLISNDVSVIIQHDACRPDEGIELNAYMAQYKEEVTFCEHNNNLNGDTILLTELIIKYIQNKMGGKNLAAVLSLRLYYNYDFDEETIMRQLEIASNSKSDLYYRFIHSIMTNSESDKDLEYILYYIQRRIGKHMPDVFDVIYLVNDFRRMWEKANLLHLQTWSQNYLSLINELYDNKWEA